MQYLLVMDSFKGSISSEDGENAVASALSHAVCIPMSDGGEGFLHCIHQAAGGEYVSFLSFDSYGNPMTAKYLRLGDTAVVETAVCDGLITVGGGNPDIIHAYSIGTGLTIRKALEDGCTEIIIGFGGSACNDGGTGALYALGARFYDKNGKQLIPGGLCGEVLDYIDFSGVTPLINNAKIVFACDVENPFYGENGASLIYSPQKGADEKTALRMDESHKRLAEIYLRASDVDVQSIPGSGAAGGLTGGLMTVCVPEVLSGFEVAARMCDLQSKIADADVIVTGEGKTDAQTLNGKLPKKVTDMAKALGKKTVCVSGCITPEGYGLGADLYIPLVRGDVTVQQAINDPVPLLKAAGAEIKEYFERN